MGGENVTLIYKIHICALVDFSKSKRMGSLNKEKQRKENNQASGNVNEIEISVENRTSESQQKLKEFAKLLENALTLQGSG